MNAVEEDLDATSCSGMSTCNDGKNAIPITYGMSLMTS
jgi:hypothetical protein